MEQHEILAKVDAATCAFSEMQNLVAANISTEAEGARYDALFDQVQAFIDEANSNPELDAHSHPLRVLIKASGL